MKYDLFEITVFTKLEDKPLPEYLVGNFSFIEGRKGQNFSLKLRNDSASRVMAIISIDGLSVLDGQACTSESRGYLVPAYGAIEIKGWRTSLSEVRTFTFETKDKSYAQGSTGQSQNCGVIGAKIFSEKLKPVPVATVVEHHHHHHHHHPLPMFPRSNPWFDKPYWMGGVGEMTKSLTYGNASYGNASTGPQYSASSNNIGNAGGSTIRCANFNATADFNLGTGMGEARRDTVQEVSFEKERELCTLTIYYADAASLEAVGLQLSKAPAVTLAPTLTVPQAFSGFCKIPAGM